MAAVNNRIKLMVAGEAVPAEKRAAFAETGTVRLRVQFQVKAAEFSMFKMLE
jgi:hypothetical protein